MGFDPEIDISLSDAFEAVRQMHTTATPLTVRKFLIGVALHGDQSGLAGYVSEYRESCVRIDRPDLSAFQVQPEHFTSIPCDFWRIGMAIGANAKAEFAVGNLGHITEMTASELPYRLRDRYSTDLQNERVSLSQIAYGIHFPKAQLLALAEDPGWQAWGAVSTAIDGRRKHGAPTQWKWDEVKVALTVEAARNPDILNQGAGPIRQFINDYMRQLHCDQLPERKEVQRYVERFSCLWNDLEDEGPPLDS
ncbi:MULTISPECIES: hypothetical protein [unclassified Novosphingobium]|uniref:hypothetical protein n=1 Tax=unclassified Novosphingobium TaxID=2644732 RepID=UPI0025CBED1B|nr:MULTISPECIES: hypothetical protein [unclassified Novosphingobium]